MVFGRIWDFVKRHRRKFVVAGVVVGGITLINRYAQRKLKEWEEKQTTEIFNRARREQHFQSTLKTCDSTITNLAPNLKDRLCSILDCEDITEQLKSKPGNRLELWDELKVLTFARIVSLVYGVGLLVTLLKVQLSILGGYMYLDVVTESLDNGGGGGLRITSSVQQKYLSLVQHLLSTGCDALAEAVKSSVAEVVTKLQLKDGLKLHQVEALITRIGAEFEAAYSKCPGGLMSVVLPRDDSFSAGSLASGSSDFEDEQTLAKIILETKDICESEDCKAVFDTSIKSGVLIVMDVVTSKYISIAQQLNGVGSSAEDERFCNPHHVEIPLAKLLPVLDGAAKLMFSDEGENLVEKLLAMSSLNTMSANIYEAFVNVQQSEDFHNHNLPSTSYHNYKPF